MTHNKSNPHLESAPLLEAELIQEGPRIELDQHQEEAIYKPQAPMLPVSTSSPMALLDKAVSSGADLAVIEKLMDLRDREEAAQARRAFNEAFAAFKAEAVQVLRNIQVTDGPLKGKAYADLAAAVDAATPALSRHGLSASWKVTKDEKEWIEVTCTVRHVAGHAETNSFGGPPDTGGAKNAIQARASSKTYLERYTFLGLLGLAAKGQDTDGLVPDMPEATFQKHLAAIRASETVDALQEVFTAAYKACGRDTVTQKALIEIKDIRKAELRKVAE